MVYQLPSDRGAAPQGCAPRTTHVSDGIPLCQDVSVVDDATGQVVNFDAVAVDGFVSQ